MAWNHIQEKVNTYVFRHGMTEREALHAVADDEDMSFHECQTRYIQERDNDQNS